MSTSQSYIRCPWCERAFTPRKTGGSRQVYCSKKCRHAVREAQVAYCQNLLESGQVTIAELRTQAGRVDAGSASELAREHDAESA